MKRAFIPTRARIHQATVLDRAGLLAALENWGRATCGWQGCRAQWRMPNIRDGVPGDVVSLYIIQLADGRYKVGRSRCPDLRVAAFDGTALVIVSGCSYRDEHALLRLFGRLGRRDHEFFDGTERVASLAAYLRSAGEARAA